MFGTAEEFRQMRGLHCLAKLKMNLKIGFDQNSKTILISLNMPKLSSIILQAYLVPTPDAKPLSWIDAKEYMENLTPSQISISDDIAKN
jgi:hypothetical protein